MESLPKRKCWTIAAELEGEVHFVSKAYYSEAEALQQLRIAEAEYESSDVKMLEDESLVPDRTMPTELQRKEICDLLHHVFVAFRRLGHEKKHDVVFELADTFHNLPQEMYNESVWDWNFVEFEIRSFEEKYPEEKVFPFSAMFRRIRGRAEQDAAPQT